MVIQFIGIDVCPPYFPFLEENTGKRGHGDVCRHRFNTTYRCPKGCVRTPNGKRPKCQKGEDDSSACRAGNRNITTTDNLDATEKRRM